MDSAFLVTNIPAPYRIPLFNEIHSQLESRNIRFEVLFAALTYPRRKWKVDMTECQFRWKVLDSPRLPTRNPEKAVFTYGGMSRHLQSSGKSITVVSGFSLATLRLWFRAKVSRQPYLIWSGAINIPGREQSRLRGFHRRLLCRGASGGIAYGTRAKDYLASLGVPADRVRIAVNTVDTSFYARETDRFRAGSPPAEGSRRQLLYLGYLTPGKRIDLILEALKTLAPHRNDFELVLVGSGPAEESLRQKAASLGIQDRVRFEGYIQRENLPRYLAQAACLLFPSEYDIWGLVLNEAMSAGVLCLASRKAGATTDLIRDGTTGFSLNFEDTPAVAERIRWLLDEPAAAERIARQGREFIEREASIRVSAAGFVQAVRDALT